MQDYILLALAPMFLACIGWEAWYLRRSGHSKYTWVDTLSNGALALMQQFGGLLSAAPVLAVAMFLHRHRLFDIELSWWTLPLLVLGQDFTYYWSHRASHRIRWLWASHVTHHSSERLNLSTAFRQSLTYPISGTWLFWLPLAWLGFAPAQIIAMSACNLAFQFFVHTEVVGRVGWLEAVLNTPSHHRVHHARNPRYIDRNYAGIFIIWDRMFGSFEPESAADPCVYGLIHPIRTHNPLTLTFHEWRAMLRDARRAGNWRAALVQLFGPPERALASEAPPGATRSLPKLAQGAE